MTEKNTTLVGLALNAEQAFAIDHKKDNAFTQMGKYTFGTVITSASAVIGAAETAIFAIAQIVLAPMYFFNPKGYSIISQHTSDSAAATALAFQRTFGFGIEKKEESSSEISKPKLKELLRDIMKELGDKFKSGTAKIKGQVVHLKDQSILKVKEHKKVGVIALAVAAAAFYYFYPEEVTSSLDKVWTGLTTTVSSSLGVIGDGFNYTGKKLSNVTEYINVWNFTIPFDQPDCPEEPLSFWTGGKVFGTSSCTFLTGWLFNYLQKN